MSYQELRRRVGKFKIGREVMEDSPQAVQLIMSRCIPVRAEAIWPEDCIEYTALSEEFQEIPEYGTPRIYCVVATKVKNDDGDLIDIDLRFE